MQTGGVPPGTAGVPPAPVDRPGKAAGTAAVPGRPILRGQRPISPSCCPSNRTVSAKRRNTGASPWRPNPASRKTPSRR